MQTTFRAGIQNEARLPDRSRRQTACPYSADFLPRRHAIPYARGRAPLGAPKPPATLLLSRSAAHNSGQHESCEGDLRSAGRVLAKVTRAIPMEG